MKLWKTHLVTLKKRGVRLIFIHFSSLNPTMLMFNLAISCLTTSNLPWSMDLTFQVPMQYCSLEHQILLSPPDTFTAKHHFHFGPATSFFLELLVIALCSTLVAYCIPSNLGAHLQASYILPFHAVHEVLQARFLELVAVSFSLNKRKI